MRLDYILAYFLPSGSIFADLTTDIKITSLNKLAEKLQQR